MLKVLQQISDIIKLLDWQDENNINDLLRVCNACRFIMVRNNLLDEENYVSELSGNII